MVFIDDAIKSAEEDMLGFDKYAKMIKGLIDDAKDKPFSIGINGKWGSGKSSLLNLVKNELETNLKTSDNQQNESDQQENEKPYKGYIIVEFDAWLYQGYQDARVALLEQLFESLKENTDDNGIKRIHTEFFKVISRLSKNPLVQSIVNVAGDRASAINEVVTQSSDYLLLGHDTSLSNDIKNLREAIEKYLDKGKKKLVVLVDDLDRCQPATAIATLEAIRLFLNIKHTAIVLAGDKEVLQQAVKKQFVLNNSDVDDRASSYFDKLITMEINMPTLSEDKVQALLEHLLVEYLVGDEKKTERESISRQVQSFFTYSPHFQGNIRNIKLFFNQLIQTEALLKANYMEVDRAIIIKMLLLKKFGHPSFFDRALLINQYCGDKHKNLIVGIFMYEKIFFDENDEITDLDREFIRLWQTMPPSLKRSEAADLGSSQARNKIYDKIEEQIIMVIEVIKFLAQQHPQKLHINSKENSLDELVQESQNFLNVDFIMKRRTLGIYKNFLALLELRQHLDNVVIEDSRVKINSKELHQQYRDAYHNLMLTLKDETEALNIGFVKYDKINLNFGELLNAIFNLNSGTLEQFNFIKKFLIPNNFFIDKIREKWNIQKDNSQA